MRSSGTMVDLDSIVGSFSLDANSPMEFLASLEKAGVDANVTEEGHLMIRCWQIAAENLFTPQQVSFIHRNLPLPDKDDKMSWLSKNLDTIRREYGGKWVAVYNRKIVASSPTLPELMSQIEGYDRPLITLIPAEPVTWTFAYARQEL